MCSDRCMDKRGIQRKKLVVFYSLEMDALVLARVGFFARSWLLSSLRKFLSIRRSIPLHSTVDSVEGRSASRRR